MNVPYSWLKEFVPGIPGPQECADLLSSIGLSIEDVHDYAGAPAGVLAVRLDNVIPVEGSDHLVKADAWDGSRHHQVLTGAPNAREGLLTAFAVPGTHLPAMGVDIGTRVMAGLKSEGMLCSARELGIYDHSAGVLELPAEVEPGAELSSLWPGDSVLELEITPNRADALSILGVARDLAAKLGLEVKLPFDVEPAPETTSGDAGVSIANEDADGCPLMTLRRVDDLKVDASPLWLQRRLAMLGLRPRNNVIDVTNYVNFELGQPSHAYDLRALEGSELGVRRAVAGEQLVTLQDETLELTTDDLVIATAGRAIGLAGVIGGKHDSVVDDTTSVALEVAHFDPVSIRASAKRHGQHTDAHYRFERGVDPNLPFLASARLAGLLEELAGGRAAAKVAVAGSRSQPGSVAFRPSRVEFLTSVDVPLADQERFLTALGCSVERQGEDAWVVTPPSWRFDIEIEEDLIEEVIRLYGFEHIGSSRPNMQFTPPLTDPTHRRLRAHLAASGFQELISYSFSSDAELQRTRAPDAVVRLRDPLGQESSVLRTALYPSLLAAAQVNRQQPSLALFEIGHVFGAEESERLAILLSGNWVEPGWRKQPVAVDAFVLSGQLAKLAGAVGADLQLVNRSFPALHPGVSAEVVWNGQPVGFLGQLHPQVASELELKDTWICELQLPLGGSRIDFSEPGRQERVERDLALIIPDSVSFSELKKLLAPPAGAELESLVPFDVYVGERIGEGRKSVALRFTFRHPERTLTDSEVTAHMSNVMGVARNAGYDVRDG